MPFWLQFLWAFAGSISTVVVLHGKYLREHKRARLPKYLTSLSVGVNRFSMALIAGLLSIAFNTTDPLLAFYIGVSAPIVIEKAMDGEKFPELEGQ